MVNAIAILRRRGHQPGPGPGADLLRPGRPRPVRRWPPTGSTSTSTSGPGPWVGRWPSPSPAPWRRPSPAGSSPTAPSMPGTPRWCSSRSSCWWPSASPPSGTGGSGPASWPLAVVAGLAGSLPNMTTNRTQAGQVAAAIAATAGPATSSPTAPTSWDRRWTGCCRAGRYQQTTFPRGSGPEFVNWVDYAAAIEGRRRPSRFAEHLESMARPAATRSSWCGPRGYQTFGVKCEGILQTLAGEPGLPRQEPGGGERQPSTNPCRWCS